MKCPYCGRELNEGSKICDGCGSQINNQPVSNSYAPIEVKQGNNFTGIIIIILFLAVAGLLLWFFVFNGSSSDNNTNNTSNEANNTVTEAKKYLTVANIQMTVNETRALVNEGRYYQFYETNKLYLIPVGEKSYGCVGESDFKSSDLKYAYIGFAYTGESFDYYVLALDKNGYGVNMVNSRDLTVDSIEKNAKEYELLTNIYNSRGDIYHIYEATDENFIPVFKVNDNIKSAVIIAEQQCKYSMY